VNKMANFTRSGLASSTVSHLIVQKNRTVVQLTASFT